jgi:hypothetical protein
MVPFIQYILLYSLKTLFGIESMHALPALLVSDEALMRLVGFNAHQGARHLGERGPHPPVPPPAGVSSQHTRILSGRRCPTCWVFALLAVARYHDMHLSKATQESYNARRLRDRRAQARSTPSD